MEYNCSGDWKSRNAFSISSDFMVYHKIPWPGKIWCIQPYLCLPLFFNVLADLGLYTSTVREISKDKNRADEIINNSITFRVILSVIVIFAAIIFSFFLYGGENNSEIRYGIALVSITILFNLINTTMNAVFQANIKMGSVIISELSGRLVTLLLVVLIINSGGGLYQVLFVTAMGSLVTALLSIILVQRFINIRPTINLRYGFGLFRKSIPLALALLINIVYFKADTIIISLFRDNTEVGIYGLSYRLLEASLIFPTFFIGSLFPVITDYAINQPHKLKSFVQKAFDILVMASIPLMAGGIIISEYLIKAVAGDKFWGSVFAFQILIAASPLIFINGLFGNMIIAKNREKEALWLNILALLFNLSLNIIFIPIYGFITAAIVTLVSEIVIMFGAVYLIRKIYNFCPK